MVWNMTPAVTGNVSLKQLTQCYIILQDREFEHYFKHMLPACIIIIVSNVQFDLAFKFRQILGYNITIYTYIISHTQTLKSNTGRSDTNVVMI